LVLCIFSAVSQSGEDSNSLVCAIISTNVTRKSKDHPMHTKQLPTMLDAPSRHRAMHDKNRHPGSSLRLHAPPWGSGAGNNITRIVLNKKPY
jgi:hypothetical protein